MANGVYTDKIIEDNNTNSTTPPLHAALYEQSPTILGSRDQTSQYGHNTE